MNNLIAVTIGDINGIGIELLINLYKKKQIGNFVLFSNIEIIKNFLKNNKYKIKINKYNTSSNKFKYKTNSLNIFTYEVKSAEDNTLKSIYLSHKVCLRNLFIGLVTLPIRKDLIIKKIQPDFIGHTEYLRNLEKKKYSNMILYNKELIVTPLTTHVELKSVSKILTKKLLYNQIKNLDLTLKKDFDIQNPKILISGINPHAGENGYIGNEEIDVINPTLVKLKKENINIFGPASADSMLMNKNIKTYNCFVFIFHDQALIPFKFISKFTGVNFTGNLSVIRTSPDHGTAYDLKGSNKFSDLSLKNCFKLIYKISKNRIKYERSKKIFKSKFFN